VTQSLGKFPADDAETSRVNEGPGRADEAGPALAWEVMEASAGNGRAQSSAPTFLKRRKYKVSFARLGPSEGADLEMFPIYHRK